MSHDAAVIVSVSEDYTLKIWNGTAGTLKQTVDITRGSYYAMAVSGDGRFAVAGGNDDCVTRYDIAANIDNGGNPEELFCHDGDVRALAVSVDGMFIVSGSDDYTVKLWSVQAQRVMFSFGCKYGGEYYGEKGYYGEESYGEDSVDCDDSHRSYVRAVAISRDGAVIISGANDGTVNVRDGDDGS
jgi:WD40 repeat protein